MIVVLIRCIRRLLVKAALDHKKQSSKAGHIEDTVGCFEIYVLIGAIMEVCVAVATMQLLFGRDFCMVYVLLSVLLILIRSRLVLETDEMTACHAMLWCFSPSETATKDEASAELI